jgi:hypothetical protein
MPNDTVPTLNNPFFDPDCKIETLDNVSHALDLAQAMFRFVHEIPNSGAPPITSTAEHGFWLAMECAKEALEYESTYDREDRPTLEGVK